MSIHDEIKAIADDFKHNEAQTGPPEKQGDSIGLKLKRGTEIVDREQRWLVTDFLPDDSLIVVAGQVGLGKTTACMDWAAYVTNGRVPIIGGKREARNVLMLSNEDSEAHLRRIFTRLGGNLARLYVEDEDSDLPWGLGDVPALEAHIVELRPALVVIDSLTTHKPSKVDLNSHGEVAPMLVALRKLAATHGTAIVVIHHTNKAQTNDPLAKISGSIGIIATARHVILIGQHPEDENIRVAAIAKTNLCKPGAQSYQFRLDPFAWHGETELRAADLLQMSGENAGSTSDAETFLSDALADGKVDCAALFREGEGYGLNRRAIQRAADKLRVKRERVGFGRGSKICWSLCASIDDTIDDTPPKTVIYGREPMESALFDTGSTIDDKNKGTVTYVSSMDGQPVFDVEF
ncbi:MAG: AAA family ATPase [Acidobacteriaceae bacterium]